MELFKSLDDINTMSLTLVSKLQFFFNSIPFFSRSRDYSTLKTLKSAQGDSTVYRLNVEQKLQ